MTSLCERYLDLFECSCYGWVRDANTVIPHDREAKFVTIVTILELILVFVPFLVNGQWVLEPGFRLYDCFHERLQSRDATGNRAKDG